MSPDAEVFTVTIEDRCTRELAAGSNSARAAIMRGVTEAGYVVQRQARRNAEANFGSEDKFMPGRQRKQELRDSIEMQRLDADLAARVGPSVIYGAMREFGGVIVPIHFTFLSWWTMDPPVGLASDIETHHLKFNYKSKKSRAANLGWAAHRVFAKRVVQRGKPYLIPALYSSVGRIVQAIEVAVQNWIAKMEAH